MRPFPTFALFAVLFVASCSDSSGPYAEKAVYCEGQDIVASNAWVRRPRTGQPTGAAYVSLCNGSGESDRLVSVEFGAADAVELHVTDVGENSVASMRTASQGIQLPPLTVTELAPGGSHIMLIKVDPALADRDEARMRLNFEKAPPVELVFEVREEEAGDHAAH